MARPGAAGRPVVEVVLPFPWVGTLGSVITATEPCGHSRKGRRVPGLLGSFCYLEVP